MEQLKFALGPYEFFASIVGGAPLVLAIFLILNPSSNVQDIVLILKDNVSASIAVSIVFLSFILGGSIQGVTWRYFLRLCNVFRQDYSYFGNLIFEKNTQGIEKISSHAASELEFEDKLVILLREKVGIPKNLRWLDARLTAYLKEHNSQAVITAESYLANHIMYRNLSFGFLVLCIVLLANLLVNLVRISSFTFESLILILLSLFLSYITFFRSLSFKKWHNRELLLSFYFSACKAMSSVQDKNQ